MTRVWVTLSTQMIGPAFFGEAPGLARYSDLCCSNDNFVLFSPEKIPSKSEVQQGDPSGPLLFDGALKAYFLKDGTVCGFREATQAFLAGFQRGPDDTRPQTEPHTERIHPSQTFGT